MSTQEDVATPVVTTPEAPVENATSESSDSPSEQPVAPASDSAKDSEEIGPH